MGTVFVKTQRSRSHAGDFACLDAGGADVQALGGLTHHGANGLDVGVPAALGTHV